MRFETGEEFYELVALYSTNSNILREFAVFIESSYLFPDKSQSAQYLTRKEFLKRMEESEYLIIKPNELRKKYTQFVYNNKLRALLPSRKAFSHQQ